MSDSSPRNMKTVIEAAAAIAVLLGLIFVGLELKQNTVALSAQAIFQLNDNANADHRSVAQDPVLAELVYKGYEEPDSLTDNERHRFTHWMKAVFNTHESAWLYHRKGILEEGDFAGWKGSTCSILSYDGARWFWKGNFGIYPDGFVDDVEKWCGLASK